MDKILAIDDKTDNLVTLCALLKNLMPGCTVITAQSGREGGTMAVSELPDVILLDHAYLKQLRTSVALGSTCCDHIDSSVDPFVRDLCLSPPPPGLFPATSNSSSQGSRPGRCWRSYRIRRAGRARENPNRERRAGPNPRQGAGANPGQNRPSTARGPMATMAAPALTFPRRATV